MNKRHFLRTVGITVVSAISPVRMLQAKTYLSIVQAQKILFPNTLLTKNIIALSKDQQKMIRKASGVRVRSAKVHAWKSPKNAWFIVDQIIGKHENIDVAFGVDPQGVFLGFEILVYRESYGHEIRNPKWKAQFFKHSVFQKLTLDKEIKNISGATLSCKHIVDGVNRLGKTWEIVLQHHTNATL